MKILFFAPHSAIWEHAFPEAIIADMLKTYGNKITYITCGETFKKFCIPMSAFGLSITADSRDKLALCTQCRINKNLIRKKFSLDGYDLQDVLSDNDNLETIRLISHINKSNFIDFQVNGIEIGRIALYEFLLNAKKNSFEFSDNEWHEYSIALENCIKSLFACQKIITQEQPDRVIIYNTLYSVNHVCKQVAEKEGIPVYFIHAGENLSNRLSTMIVAKDTTFKYRKELITHWPDYRDKISLLDKYSDVTDHFLEIMGGKHFLAYSSAKEHDSLGVRAQYNIPKDAKILTATMSSNDERFAAESIRVVPVYNNLIFPLQVNWIQCLIDYVKKKENLFLIIRVHPREFPNKRDRVKSEHAVLLEKVFQKLPRNVIVNWPTDELSLYDLAQDTAVFLNAWSSVGEEMSLLGIPVVIYSDKLILYPSDLNYLAEDKQDYFEKIEQALKDGWDFEKTRSAYRWYILRFHRGVINFKASYDPTKRPKVIQFVNKIFNKFFPIYPNYIVRKYDVLVKINYYKQEDIESINKMLLNQNTTLLDTNQQNIANQLSIEEETMILKHEVTRLQI